MVVDVIIPAFNEEASVGKVIQDIPSFVREVVVVNNNSTDETEKMAKNVGATVLKERFQGYGASCLRGIAYLNEKEILPDIVVFIDADYSDYPEEMPLMISPIVEKKADMVIGSRSLGKREKGAMLPQQLFGNWLATNLLKLFYKAKFTDLGPFRAITLKALNGLEMKDKTYGWTVEMQLKAAKQRLRFCEVPVNYKRRIGKSKIAGTAKGTFLAGYKIITTLLKYL